MVYNQDINYLLRRNAMSVYQRHNSLSKRTFNTVIYTDFSFHSHFHKNIEFVYVFDGELKVTADNVTETVKAGHFAVISPMTVHSFETPLASRVWVGVFSNDYVGEFCSYLSNKTCQKLSFKITDREHTESMIEHIDEMNDFCIKGFLYECCGEFTDKCAPVEADSKRNGIFSAVIAYIADNYRTEITLESLASTLGYEPHYLSRRLHESTGVNLRTLINGYRVDLAKDLLIKGSLTVSEVAMQCGFHCIRSFNRVFKQMTGVEPKQYASLSKK
jgi:AraC-like DNA-binding protein